MSIQALISLILRGIAVAMGVAAVVLGIKGGTNVETLVALLGIGLFSLSLWALQQKES